VDLSDRPLVPGRLQPAWQAPAVSRAERTAVWALWALSPAQSGPARVYDPCRPPLLHPASVGAGLLLRPASVGAGLLLRDAGPSR